MPGGLWRPAAACGGGLVPSNNLYSILVGWMPPKLDDLKEAGILAAGWLLASWLRMLMNVNAGRTSHTLELGELGG